MGARRIAACRCGQLKAECVGEPVRVSVCHCLDCQRRSGSAFAAQARWPSDDVKLEGDSRAWETKGATFRFCPACGSTIAFTIDALPGLTAVPVGAFADPSFPPPAFSNYEERRHPWVAILGDGIEHFH